MEGKKFGSYLINIPRIHNCQSFNAYLPNEYFTPFHIVTNEREKKSYPALALSLLSIVVLAP